MTVVWLYNHGVGTVSYGAGAGRFSKLRLVIALAVLFLNAKNVPVSGVKNILGLGCVSHFSYMQIYQINVPFWHIVQKVACLFLFKVMIAVI